MYILVLLFSFALTSSVQACSVCAYGVENRDAYVFTTILLSAVPLLIIFALIIYFRKMSKKPKNE